MVAYDVDLSLWFVIAMMVVTMHFFFRLGKFLKNYLFRHPLYVLTYSFFYFRSDCVSNITLLNKEAVTEAIVKGKSIIRFGDGEINLFLGIDNHYQKYSLALAQALKNIISQTSAESPHLLALPRFLNWPNTKLNSIKRLHLWLPFKVFFFFLFPKNIGYMDAHNFYYDNYFETVLAPVLPKVPIIILTNQATIDSMQKNENLPWSDVRYIRCPDFNAYEVVSDIKRQLDTELVTLSVKPTILIALGPVGKCLAFEYSQKGYQCIDIGRGIERIYTDVSLEQFAI